MNDHLGLEVTLRDEKRRRHSDVVRPEPGLRIVEDKAPRFRIVRSSLLTFPSAIFGRINDSYAQSPLQQRCLSSTPQPYQSPTIAVLLGPMPRASP